MRLTARQLNRAMLGRQLLLQRESLGVVDGMHRVVAIQAQEAPSPYLALWNRLEGFDGADLDRAFTDGSVVKATLMRVTLHVVGGADYPAFHEAMQTTLRAARYHDGRFKRTGLTKDDADALVPEVLAFAATPRTNAEVEAWIDERLGELPKPGVWWALRQVGPFVHAPNGGPWSFGPRPAYVAARVLDRPGEPVASLAVLLRRYLEGFGPASAQDFGRFALVNMPSVRAALERLGDGVVELEGPNGEKLFDVPGGLLPPEDASAPPRLLPMWDETLLAHVDRTRIIPADYRKLTIRSNGDVLPTLLVDGYVAGVWRPVAEGIEATAFQRLDDDAWAGLEAEAHALLTFLADRGPLIYTRYARWWADLPAAEVRVLGR